jgi:hypothetical protein
MVTVSGEIALPEEGTLTGAVSTSRGVVGYAVSTSDLFSRDGYFESLGLIPDESDDIESFITYRSRGPSGPEVPALVAALPPERVTPLNQGNMSARIGGVFSRRELHSIVDQLSPELVDGGIRFSGTLSYESLRSQPESLVKLVPGLGLLQAIHISDLDPTFRRALSAGTRVRGGELFRSTTRESDATFYLVGETSFTSVQPGGAGSRSEVTGRLETLAVDWR